VARSKFIAAEKLEKIESIGKRMEEQVQKLIEEVTKEHA
jgi:hypothetical protein